MKSETFSPIMIEVPLVLARIQFDQLTCPWCDSHNTDARK